MDFIFHDIPERLAPLDFDQALASPPQFEAVATDVFTGRAVVIAPAAHLEMARFEKDRARLLAACRQGVADGEKALPQIQSLNASGEAV